jgi:hypothetical protein
MNMQDHLLTRWCDTDKYPHTVVTDTMATFPLWNMSGQRVGFQTYSPLQPKKEVGDPRLQKYFSWVTKPCASKNAEIAVFGLETVQWNDQLLFLTEGIFDAARLHWFGLPAVAVLSNNPVHLVSWLDALPSHKVACVQGDQAGMKLRKYGDSYVQMPDGHDVNSLPEQEFLQLFGRYM